MPTQVVIDRESVANRPIGATAWSRIEGREYDDLSEDDLSEESDRKQPADSKRLQ
jgi:ribosomal protein L14E/L6E/L27E